MPMITYKQYKILFIISLLALENVFARKRLPDVFLTFLRIKRLSLPVLINLIITKPLMEFNKRLKDLKKVLYRVF